MCVGKNERTEDKGIETMNQIVKRPLKISLSDRIICEQHIARKDALMLWIHAQRLASVTAGRPACANDWWFDNVIEPLAERYVEALGGTYEIYAGLRYILGRRIFVSRGNWTTGDQRPSV